MRGRKHIGAECNPFQRSQENANDKKIALFTFNILLIDILIYLKVLRNTLSSMKLILVVRFRKSHRRENQRQILKVKLLHFLRYFKVIGIETSLLIFHRKEFQAT